MTWLIDAESISEIKSEAGLTDYITEQIDVAHNILKTDTYCTCDRLCTVNVCDAVKFFRLL